MEKRNFIEILKDAIGDESKITQALSTKNTPQLQEYLIQIGVDPKLTELAAVVELTRLHFEKVLRDPNCKVMDTGIYYDNGNEVKVDKSGKFYLSKNSYFVKSQESDEVFFYEKGPIVYETTVINNFGAVIYSETSGLPPFTGEYSSCERLQTDGYPMILTESTDSASYSYSDRVVDFGHPIYPASKKSEFHENYYTYGNLYPKLKEWYNLYFPMQEKDDFECTQILNEKQHQLDIEKLSFEISDCRSSLRAKREANKENQNKLDKLLEYIETIKNRTPIGKSVANKILESLNDIKAPNESELEKQDYTVEGKDESSLEKKLRLEKLLDSLKQQYSEEDKKSHYIKKQIDTIQVELRQIPLIGGTLARKASKISNPKSSHDER